MKIAFIGWGEAARAFTDSLARLPAVVISAAYDLRQDDDIRQTAERCGLRLRDSAARAIENADWIISAVTADQSLAAAQSVVPALAPGQLFIDINSVSPGRKQKTATLIEAQGGQYLDMAVMAPVHPRGHATPVLIAGTPAKTLAPTLGELGFQFEIAGEVAGEATAIKMVRSMFVKGLEALTVETLLAASATGCLDQVLTSLADTFPGLGWPDNVHYMFERTLRHGVRRAAEMREVEATYEELGFVGALAGRIADIQQRMGDAPADDLPEGELQDAIRKIAAMRLAPTSNACHQSAG